MEIKLRATQTNIGKFNKTKSNNFYFSNFNKFSGKIPENIFNKFNQQNIAYSLIFRSMFFIVSLNFELINSEILLLREIQDQFL